MAIKSDHDIHPAALLRQSFSSILQQDKKRFGYNTVNVTPAEETILVSI